MTPYFIAPPLPGRGIDIVVRQFEKMDFQYSGNFKKNNVSINILVKTYPRQMVVMGTIYTDDKNH